MAARLENLRVGNRATTTELTLDAHERALERSKEPKNHRLDSEAMLKEHRRVVNWYFQEREKQAANRYQMAIDQDFYDNLQWAQEEAEDLMGRGQAPLVYNEVAPMVDWLIGTERRTRVDWKVLPRAEDDVDTAETKTKVLKYLADVNRVQFNRSRAFSDAVKVGIGWLDSGVCNDPSKEPIYNRYEDWRYVLWDSAATDLGLDDARYLFRWKWVDLDIATAIFRDRKSALRRATVASALMDEEEEDFWYLGQHFQARDETGQVIGRRTYMSDAGMINNRRERVKLIECWYRMPALCKICIGDEEYAGKEFDPTDAAMAQARSDGAIGVYDQIKMRMYVAIFTEKDLIAHGRSPYRHEKFPLTPIWCYRRGRDRMPYGVIRRVRDIQEDLNKRASKALFILSTNQVVAEDNATDDWEMLREEADRPDGVIIHKRGSKLELRRDTEMARGQLEFMELDGMKIQRNVGVNDENLGRQTNAESGEAIKARQLQGSVTTTEPYDNLRLAVQIDGEKQLSLAEQYMSAPKVIRLTGQRGAVEWVKINQPEVQPDGSVRWLNDVTASIADFVVSEADFHGSLRQAMFETMMQMVSRAGITPEFALKLLRMAFEFSDFPNKDEIVADLRRMTGEPDPTKKLTPEEQAQQQAVAKQQQDLMRQQQQLGELAVQEQAAKVKKLNAEAEKIINEAAAATAPEGDAGQDIARQIEDAVREVQVKADAQIAALNQKLVQAQNEATMEIAEARRQADSTAEVARITKDGEVRIAEINAEASKVMESLQAQMEALAGSVKELAQRRTESEGEKPEQAAAPAQPAIVIESGAIVVNAGSAPVEKSSEDDGEEKGGESSDGTKRMKVQGPGGKTFEGEVKTEGKVKTIKITRPDGQVYTGTIEES